MARLFIAVDIPERIRDEVATIYAAIPGAKWVSESQIHITLRFVGEVDPVQEQRVLDALGKVAVQPFSLELNGTGFFPPRKNPRVLWVGIRDATELLRLQARVERALVSTGLPPDDRRFHPHVTVARLNGSTSDRIARFIADNALFRSEPFTVSRFCLYESHLRREGALHELVDSFPRDATAL